MSEGGEKPRGRWCLVGNVVEERRYGEHGEIRRGTRLFAPGAKVYCLPAVCTSYGGDRLFAIGRHRKSGRFIGTIIRPEFVVEPRAKVVYHPEVLRRIDEEFCSASAKRGMSDPWTDRESIEEYIARMDRWAEPRRPTRPARVLPTEPPADPMPAVVYDDLVAKGLIARAAPLELLRGALVWTPPRSPLAMAGAAKARRALEAIIREGWHVREGEPVRASTHDQPRPALAVVCGRRDLYEHQPPGPRATGLIVEVAGPRWERSRGKHGELYAEAGFPRCWVIDLDERTVDVLVGPRDGAYVREATLPDDVDIALELDGRALGSIPVAELLP